MGTGTRTVSEVLVIWSCLEPSAESMVLSCLLDILLYGVLTAQICQYYSAFPNDRTWQKCLVYTSFTLYIYIKLGQGFGDLNVLSKLSLGMKFMPLSTGAVSGAVQIFYAYQICVVSRSKYLAGIAILSLLQIVASFYQGVRLIIILLRADARYKKTRAPLRKLTRLIIETGTASVILNSRVDISRTS
ncbi:hypothetical protein K435DRAFT_793028 [Dendrothele bispora CBS 962.96]|uniref:Uncharacterized protein n=1 Tax=Dendrothele bispora (strain CBS 962.96) TaxID=1314807 RepID=A0A4S8MH40_DENBC|nr:hypothetical protein K435DRAFT_793028 [Dendrothele bispora CBS 962.96]